MYNIQVNYINCTIHKIVKEYNKKENSGNKSKLDGLSAFASYELSVDRDTSIQEKKK